MSLTRKSFIASAALAASAAALAKGERSDAAMMAFNRTPMHFHILKEGEYDRDGMMKTLAANAAHKQVYESVSPLLIAPGIASIYMHMQNAMNAFQFSYGMGANSLATLAVFIGPSVVFALNDRMWTKYHLGDAFKLDKTNTYYISSSSLDLGASPDDPNGIYQDWSGEAVLKRGGAFMVCHNATTAIAGMIAERAKLNPADVLAEWSANMLHGFKFVPAGVAAVQLAQDNGWKVYALI